MELSKIYEKDRILVSRKLRKMPTSERELRQSNCSMKQKEE